MTEPVSNEREPLRLDDRLALRIEEAAEVIGLSERAFREHILPHCPKFYAGRAVVIPRRLFQKFIEELALSEQRETDQAAAELLAAAEARLENTID